MAPDSRPTWNSSSAVTGRLHIYVAFDWGEEVDLDQARRLVAAELHVLPRRRRTPSSFTYRPAPLRVVLPPVLLELPGLGSVAGLAEATVFDFAALSVALHVPFEMNSSALRHLAGHLAEAGPLVQAARAAVEPLYRQLLPAVQQPHWSDLSEEYFVFELAPPTVPPLEDLLGGYADWLAGLARLEPEPLYPEEVAEAVRLRLRYGTADLLVPDWAAAVLIDRDCDETLQVIEFANLQLLEFREIDRRLDDRLTAAYGLIHTLAQRWLPFWRAHTRQLRALGELKMQAHTMFGRASNVLKLFGDQYPARVYHLLAERFHLDDWEQSIHRSLAVVEGVYQVVSDQAASYRTELLEAALVLVIFMEIVVAVLGKG